MDRQELAHGWFGPIGDDEVELVSTVSTDGHSDVAKYRGAVAAEVLGPTDFNLAAFTGNIRRPDGAHEEYGGYRVGIRPDRKGGALRLFVRDEHGNELEIAYFDQHNTVLRNAPKGGGAAFPKAIALRSRANGKIVCADAGGAEPLQANRDAVGQWETFDVIPVP